MLILFTEIITVHCAKHTKHTNKLGRQDAELLNAKVGDIVITVI
jgi:hypothetical protein